MTDRVFVTGAAGFLGSHAVRLLARTGRTVIGFDALTYASDTTRLCDVDEASFRLERGDVADRRAVRRALQDARPDAVVHFAASSHVTRGEVDADSCHRTNVDGTRVVLEESEQAGAARFVHISTDEVYGPILEGSFREEDKKPRAGLATNAYARSKGVADDLVSGFSGSMRTVVVRPTNCFGPWQHPEKAFARWVTSGLVGETLPVWGGGRQVRQWLYVEDLAAAIVLLVDEPEPEPVYNVGPRHDPEIHNHDLALWILAFLGLPADRILMTRYDRPHHDARYSVDPRRIESLGWRTSDVWESFARTADWYRSHPAWWLPHRREAESIYRDRA